jgi:hypothetical protein
LSAAQEIVVDDIIMKKGGVVEHLDSYSEEECAAGKLVGVGDSMVGGEEEARAQHFPRAAGGVFLNLAEKGAVAAGHAVQVFGRNLLDLLFYEVSF